MAEKNFLLKANQTLGRLFNFLTLVGASFIAVIVFMTILDVLLRSFFNHPLDGCLELSELFTAPLIWLGFAYTMRTGGHVRMEMLSSALFKGRKEIFYWITIHLILIVFGVLMCLAMYDGIVYSIRSGEFGDITHIPVYPFKIVLFGGCVLFLLELLAELALDFASLHKSLKGGHE